MYAETDEKLAEAINEIEQLDNQERFISRMQKNLDRREEWVLLYRLTLLTRHNNTNAYAEATIRILKDVVLSRTKAFNVVALVEFCGTIWNKYFIGRLLNFANGRRAEPLLGYAGLCKRMEKIDLEEIKQIDHQTFAVPSATHSDAKYTIDVTLGVCSCPSGCEGRFCKHQAILHKHLGVMLPNVPPINASERYALAQLALGDKCPKPEFFKVCIPR